MKSLDVVFYRSLKLHVLVRVDKMTCFCEITKLPLFIYDLIAMTFFGGTGVLEQELANQFQMFEFIPLFFS